MLRPDHISPEVREVLRRIDEAKVGMMDVRSATPEQVERWLERYAECAAKHGASLDSSFRTVPFDAVMEELGLTAADLEG